MSMSKIHCATTRMFNGKLIVVRVSNMLSCFPPSVSYELLGTAHTHLPSFPLTASSLLFPSCSFVHPSQQCCPLQEQHALLLIESNLQSPFSCILLKRVLLLIPLSPFFSHATASLSVGVGIQGVCLRKFSPLRGSGSFRALCAKSIVCSFYLQFLIHPCQAHLLLQWSFLCMYICSLFQGERLLYFKSCGVTGRA